MGGLYASLDSMLETENSICEQSDHKALLSRSNDETSPPLNLVWREKVVQWCYDVTDHLNEDRSVVYVAMNILDRFCAASATARPMDEKMYEVSSLSSVFLAVRIAGSGELLLQELLSMSRGGITIQDIVTTGTSIISALSWESRILTPIDFVKSIFLLIPSSYDASPHNQALLDSSSYLIELAVCDVFFSNFKASSVAVAAMLNALHASNLGPEDSLLMGALRKATPAAVDSEETLLLCARLDGIYNRSVDNIRQSGPHLIEDDQDEIEATVLQAEDYALYTRNNQREAVSANNSAVAQKRAKVEHYA